MTDLNTFIQRLNAPIIEEPWKAEWSRKLADEMRRNAARRTGELANSIRETADGVEVEAEHGPYVEYGTSDTPAQPFAGPAVNRLARPAAEDAGRLVIRQLT